MTYALSPIFEPRRRLLWAVSLIAASILLSFAIACAAPLAAFAAVAALTLNRRDAAVLSAAVWLANQFVGFAFLHYPTDATTLAWGAALGVIALLSCESAGLVGRRVSGLVGAAAAFVAAFVVYESALRALTDLTGPATDHFTMAVVSRIFLTNAGAFAGLLTLKAGIGALLRKPSAALAPGRA
jgi:hypothetical protein